MTVTSSVVLVELKGEVDIPFMLDAIDVLQHRLIVVQTRPCQISTRPSTGVLVVDRESSLNGVSIVNWSGCVDHCSRSVGHYHDALVEFPHSSDVLVSSQGHSVVVHVDVLVQMGAVQHSCEIELLIASNHLEESSISSMVVVSHSERVMPKRDLIVKDPVFGVLHMNISK